MKRVILGRTPAGVVATRLVQLRYARYADEAMLEPVRVLNTVRPVRALKRLFQRYGRGAIQVALTRAGVWTRYPVTSPRQLEVALQQLPRARILRVLHELEHHHG